MEALRQQIAAMRQSLFDEEILGQYFLQLEELEGDSNLGFVQDIVTLYFADSTKPLAAIEDEMMKTPVDFVKLDKCLHQRKRCSSSIGANKDLTEVNKGREFCMEKNLEGSKASFEQLKVEHATLKAKLEAYFELNLGLLIVLGIQKYSNMKSKEDVDGVVIVVWRITLIL